MTIEDEERYAEFGRRAFAIVKQSIQECSFDCDAEELADIAVQCGLMIHVPFDPAKHDKEFFGHEYEVGDMIYYWGGEQ